MLLSCATHGKVKFPKTDYVCLTSILESLDFLAKRWVALNKFNLRFTTWQTTSVNAPSYARQHLVVSCQCARLRSLRRHSSSFFKYSMDLILRRNELTACGSQIACCLWGAHLFLPICLPHFLGICLICLQNLWISLNGGARRLFSQIRRVSPIYFASLLSHFPTEYFRVFGVLWRFIGSPCQCVALCLVQSLLSSIMAACSQTICACLL